MSPPAYPGKGWDAAWLLVVGLLSSAWCLVAAEQQGVTFDEPFYIKSGLHHWRTGSNKPLMSAGTMPLPVDVETLPIYLWERSRGTPFDPVADLPEILPVARSANLVFWWLLLAYGLALGRELGGPWAGRAAAALLASEPNLLAHAGLATTDIAVTAGVLAAAYHTYRGLGRGWGWRVVVPGIVYGVAVLAKGSALAFVPLVYFVLGLLPLVRSGSLIPPAGSTLWGRLNHLRRTSLRLRWDLTYVILIGLAVVFAYCGSDFGTEWTFIEWAGQLPDGTLKQVMLPLSENLCIFPNAGEGLLQQVKHNIRGHGAFLRGEWHPRAVWYYFPVALSAKLTLSVLGLLAATLVLRPRSFLNPAGSLTLALLVFSLNCRVQIGIRLIFPLVGLLLVALSVAAFRRQKGNPAPQPLPARRDGEGEQDVCHVFHSPVGFASRPPSPPRGGDGGGVVFSLFRLFVGITVIGQLVAAATAWPDGLRYSNRLWGGPDRTYEALTDSNSDWGEGVKDLAEWSARQTGGAEVAVWYFGTDPAAAQPPFRVVPLHFIPFSPERLARTVGTRYLAVSSALLYGNPDLTPSTRALTDWLKAQPLAARTRTFFVYDVSEASPRTGPSPAP